MEKLDLKGNWTFYKDNEKEKLSAVVPGTLFLDLLNNEKMEDPFYRDNEKYARELSFHEYTYERDFEVSTQILSFEKLFLCCEGLDTLTSIYINKNLIGKTDNMHRYYEFDLTQCLILGINQITVIFASATEFAEKAQEKNPLFQFDITMPGMGHIRKGHYMLGWDWGPQLPDLGIFRPIYMKAYNLGRLVDVSFGQIHEDNSVEIKVDCIAELFTEVDVQYEIIITNPKGNVKYYTTKQNSLNIKIEDPMLWWPNGHGEQNLYQIEIKLLNGETLLDKKQYQIGLRTMELIQEEDQWGVSCYIKVNNVPIYLKGANYIPEDNILSRCNKEKTRRLLEDCIEANHNTIRVWGGGIYPEEYFYDLCDELGLLVWQDLMFACGTYDTDNEQFLETTLAEIEYNIKRIRHRACLGLICGNNEMEVAHVEWNVMDLEKSKEKYLVLFEDRLPKLAQKVAPEVEYWLASPTSGGNFHEPNSENRGDMHYWGVWHQKEPFTEYRNINPRMMSEFGIQSFPCIKTMETCTIEEDRNIFSRIMELHQRAGSEGNGLILHYLSQLYRYPKNFESLLYVSQMIQAEGIRYGVEHWRRIFGRCMGTIYWQLNDCWPVASWSSIDSLGRWKALHYFGKKFYAPVLVSVNDKDKKLQVVVTNDLNKKKELELTWKFMNFKGTILKTDTLKVEIGECRAKEVTNLDFSNDLVTKDLDTEVLNRNHLVYFELRENNKIISTNIVYFAPVKYMELQKPDIKVAIEENDDCYSFTFNTDCLVKSLFVDFIEYDFVVSDNYFDLIPGIEKTIILSKDRTDELLKTKFSNKELIKEELISQLKLMSIVDTY